jgi:hypothetical protein
MTFKQKANKELKDEIKDLLLEKEEMRQRRLEAESEWEKEYVESFRKECKREEIRLLDVPEIFYDDGSE